MNKISLVVEELVRLFAMRFVLAPAASLLPKSWTLSLADFASLFLLILPNPGAAEYFRIRETFGKGRFESLHLTRQRLGRPFRDFAVLSMILNRREHPLDWKIIEKNANAVQSIRASGQSYILATAHFTRQALMALSCPRIVPGNLVQAAVPTPEPCASLSEWIRRIRIDGLYKTLYDQRIRVQLGTIVRAYASAWNRKIEYAYVGSSLFAAELIYRRLKQAGTVVTIAIDAWWPNGPYTRPFAGIQNRPFSTGAAQLAKLARCPILSCIYFMENDGSIVVEWGTPIERVHDEVEAMNRLLDMMENAIGERPTQYLLEIGDGQYWNSRHWNSTQKCWEKRPR